MPSRRQAQLATQIQRNAAQAIAGLRLSTLITVTRCTISPDARNATVYLSGWRDLSTDEQATVRRLVVDGVVRESTTKYTARIELAHDEAIDHASHINDLLSSTDLS